MKKLLLGMVAASLLSTHLLAGWGIGTVHEVSARSDGTVWVSMKRTTGTWTNLYKIEATGEALKAMTASAISAKLSNSPVRMLWINSGGGVWTSVDFLP